jgi:HEAT repeat protein
MRVVIGACVLCLSVLVSSSVAQSIPERVVLRILPQTHRQNPSESKEEKVEPPTHIGGRKLADWINLLRGEDTSKRAEAMMNIPFFGEGNERAVPALLDCLKHPDLGIRNRALATLRLVGIRPADVKPVINALAARLNPQIESSAHVRYEATVTLRRFIEDAVPALDGLISCTRDRNAWELRHSAIALIWRIGVSARQRLAAESSAGNTESGQQWLVIEKKVYEALLDQLRNDRNYQIRLETLQGLAALGAPEDPALLNRLLSELNAIVSFALNSKQRPLAIWAYAALVSMQNEKEAAKESLVRIARHLSYGLTPEKEGKKGSPTLAKSDDPEFTRAENLQIRMQAAMALGGLGERAKSQVPALIKMLSDKEPLAVGAACTALAMIGDTSEGVVEALTQMIDPKDPQRAGAAVMALVQLRVKRQSLFDKFLEIRKDPKLDRGLRVLLEEAEKELKKPDPKKPQKADK